MIATRICLLLSMLCLSLGYANAKELPQSKFQRLYLPIYSHIAHGNSDRSGKASMALLSAMVSIRNTDSLKPIKLLSAKYYDTEGRFLRNYVVKPVLVNPFGTYELFVDSNDKSGGSGANFVIEWESDALVSSPLVEAVHISLISGRSITVKTEAVEIRHEDR